jgi:Lrp/AsnC family transcriptional regulator, regulator of ectoine-degradation genes
MSRLALDDRDIRILSVLSREGRISKTELADRVHLSATACWDRIKRLEAAGLIRGYRAEIALARLAPHVVIFVTVELESHRPESFQAFEIAVGRHEEIVAAWSLGGGVDYLLQIVTRDIDSYQRLIDALLAGRVGVRRYFTYVVTKDVKAVAPPLDSLLAAPPKE